MKAVLKYVVRFRSISSTVTLRLFSDSHSGAVRSVSLRLVNQYALTLSNIRVLDEKWQARSIPNSLLALATLTSSARLAWLEFKGWPGPIIFFLDWFWFFDSFLHESLQTLFGARNRMRQDVLILATWHKSPFSCVERWLQGCCSNWIHSHYESYTWWDNDIIILITPDYSNYSHGKMGKTEKNRDYSFDNSQLFSLLLKESEWLSMIESILWIQFRENRSLN